MAWAEAHLLARDADSAEISTQKIGAGPAGVGTVRFFACRPPRGPCWSLPRSVRVSLFLGPEGRLEVDAVAVGDRADVDKDVGEFIGNLAAWDIGGETFVSSDCLEQLADLLAEQ